MAAVVAGRAMNLDGNADQVHPFFVKKIIESKPGNPAHHDEDEQLSNTDMEGEQKEVSKKRGKRSKKHDDTKQKTIFQGFGIKSEVTSETAADPDATTLHSEADLEQDPNYDRRKRQKTVSPSPQTANDIRTGDDAFVIPDSEEGTAGLDWHEQLKLEASKGTEHVEPIRRTAHAAVRASANGKGEQDVAPMGQEDGKSTDEVPRETKKAMRLKGGTLASPKARANESGISSRKGQARKAADRKSLIVKIDYARLASSAPELGARIQNILDNEYVHHRARPMPNRPSTPQSKPAQPPKSTHPFFLGKVAKIVAESKGPEVQNSAETDSAQSINSKMPSPRKASATTPGKIKAQRDAFKLPTSPSSRPLTVVHEERKKLKYLGNHPAWPTKLNAHVRGLENKMPEFPPEIELFGFPTRSSKRRLHSNSIGREQSVLHIHQGKITQEQPALRLPVRMVTTGPEIQSLVVQTLSTASYDISRANLVSSSGSMSMLHPALLEMFSGIVTSLTPFDKFECEVQMWTQKYAPKSASQVLQTGKEAQVLRDWLQRRTITAVQTGSNRSTASSTISSRAGKKPAERKGKRKDVDDFIVDSDDELDQNNELLPLSDESRCKVDTRSIARGGDDFAQSTPGATILLSGPQGCGKTAAVYAVAKELGFEIFEINSAARRSGKDVLEKIGDMTENHLVHQVSKALTEDKSNQVGLKPEAVLIQQPDAPDPKQKSMASFFGAAPASTKPAPTNKSLLSKSLMKTKEESSKPKAQQKQSLILLEEVDVLFEEDKQFWLTVLTLAIHSKRPIIMTCNDEKFIPLEALTFHAILRFVQPSVDLATDYLLLLAAREGHVLQRAAAESLYQTKNHDLRGAITELNFWCQMAVGDTTRGFNWMIDRYPPGVDVDEQGCTLRVASEGTFVRGMNVISNDLRQSVKEEFGLAEALWSQAWDDWQLDAIDLLSNAQLPDGLHDMSSYHCDEVDRLEHHAFIADVLSAGDVSFGFSMREPNKQHLDHTLPPMREKIRTSHAISLSGTPDILQVEPMSDFTSLDKHLAVASQTRIAHLPEKLETTVWNKSSTTAADRIIRDVEMKMSPNEHQPLSRHDFAAALDTLAYDPEDSSPGLGSYIAASSFDREFSVITTDLAPYARTIAREYQTREDERLRMSNLLSAGGKRRQTRAANAAMDGGRRSERRARYFETLQKMEFNAGHVLATGGEGWHWNVDAPGTATNSIAGDYAECLRDTEDSDHMA